MLQGEYAKMVGTKQWDQLRLEGKNRVYQIGTLQDEDQKEFYKIGAKIKKEEMKKRQAEEERLRALEAAQDHISSNENSEESLERHLKCKKNEMNQERKEAADRLAALKLKDRKEGSMIKNQLYRQKHKV